MILSSNYLVAATLTKQKPLLSGSPASTESEKKEEDHHLHHHHQHQQDEDTDTEAKESEADQENVKPSPESGGKETRARFIVTSNQIAKASQTEPLRR